MTQSPHSDMEGRVAIVTGAARNIGRSIALDLAGAGAAVMVHARNSGDDAQAVVDEIRGLGGHAIRHLADLSQPGPVAGMVEAAIAEFGRLDVLVNNAASRGDTRLSELGFDAFREVHASIVDATFLCSQACAPHIARSDRGAIVNIGGVAGFVGLGHRVHVVSAKAAVAGLTRALAAELAANGTTVNCVSPGHVDTKRDHVPPHFVDRRPPLDRAAEPREIADAVAFLCGRKARYITGQIIHVNGGWHMGS